jgi:hypothetical protein
MKELDGVDVLCELEVSQFHVYMSSTNSSEGSCVHKAAHRKFLFSQMYSNAQSRAKPITSLNIRTRHLVPKSAAGW